MIKMGEVGWRLTLSLAIFGVVLGIVALGLIADLFLKNDITPFLGAYSIAVSLVLIGVSAILIYILYTIGQES
jgi:hypothetical protein